MAAAFISITSGGQRDVTVPSGATLMVVNVLAFNNESGYTGSFDGAALSVATNSNDFSSVLYMIDPPEGEVGPLVITPDDFISTILVSFYSGDLAFESGQQASAASASYDPAGAGLIVHGVSAVSTSGTPVASTNERFDSGGSWYGDRIVSDGSVVTVGVSSATDPDYSGAIFTETTGASLTATAAFSAQSATAAATLLRARSVSAAFVAQAATAAATAVLGHPATASFTAQSATAAATATVTGNKTATASFAAQAATVAVTASHGLPASAAFQAQSATMAATAAAVGTKTLTAAFQAQSATVAVSVSVPAQLPGTATARVTAAGSSAVATSDPAGVTSAGGAASVSTTSPTAAVRVGRATGSVIG